jgi:hypothetical protein
VDRIDAWLGDHQIVVMVRIFCPVIGTRWVDRFSPDELESVGTG